MSTLEISDIPVSAVYWTPCYRLVPSRFPPIDLFERVADAEDLESVHAIEAMTNSRLRDAVGDITLVPKSERVSGVGASWLMAPFTHLSPTGARFSTSAFGAYYTALELDTAITETVYHRERFLRATNEAPIEIDMREIRARLRADLHDMRASSGIDDDQTAALYASDDDAASQHIAEQLRAAGSQGVVYDSVRHDGGECAAVFSPRRLTHARQADHWCYMWDGTRIASVYRKSGWRVL